MTIYEGEGHPLKTASPTVLFKVPCVACATRLCLQQTLDEISILSACTMTPPQQPEPGAYILNLDSSIR